MNIYLLNNQKMILILFFIFFVVIYSLSLFCGTSAKTDCVANKRDCHQKNAFCDKDAVAKMAKNFESPERDSMQQPQKILQYLGNIQGKTIMDIGAATGYFSVKFAKNGAQVIAADISEPFQKYLEDRIQVEQLENIELRRIAHDDPQLKDAEVDIVFIANSYHHISDRAAYFSKVKMGLKPDGELIIVDFFKKEFSSTIQAPPIQMRTAADEVIAELKKAGFSSFDVNETLLPYHYIIKAKVSALPEFWEHNFKEKHEMWGLDPSNSALAAADFFNSQGLKHVLIPGIGYGRNAQAFINKGIEIVGIEISATAIAMARNHYGESMKIYHGSVLDMPFDNQRYDGIYSHALIHLLDENERIQLIKCCYDQLIDGGVMIFTAITKKAPTYGKGTLISKDRFAQFGGVNMFFYDRETIQKEFGDYGLIEIKEIIENYPFYVITCKKN